MSTKKSTKKSVKGKKPSPLKNKPVVKKGKPKPPQKKKPAPKKKAVPAPKAKPQKKPVIKTPAASKAVLQKVQPEKPAVAAPVVLVPRKIPTQRTYTQARQPLPPRPPVPIKKSAKPSAPSKGGKPAPGGKGKPGALPKGGKPVPPKKKKKIDIEAILSRPRGPVFVKKVEVPKITFPEVKGPKKMFKMEFSMRCSPNLLFNYLSTASGLQAWFANDVNIRDNMVTFYWNGSSASAKIIAKRDDMIIAYQWLDESDQSYFVFEILQDDITGDVALIVTDFALPSEVEQNRLLWNSQVHALAQVIGS